jgi:hypothetical protein
MKTMKEGEDFTFTPEGLMVFTAAYLKRRGFCCGNGCRNCPYDYVAVPEARRKALLANRSNGNIKKNNTPD